MKHSVAVVPLAFALLVPTALEANDYIPTRYDDPAPGACLPSDCSLREAILAANADAAPDRVLLSAGEYQLTIPGAGETFSATGSIDIREDLELRGPGATMTRIVAAGLDDRAVVVAEGAHAIIVGLAIVLADKDGLLALNTGTVVEMQHCLVEANGLVSGTGSGVFATVGTRLLISNTSFVGNDSSGAQFTQAEVVLENVTSSGNQVGLSFSLTTSARCHHCTMADNTAQTLIVGGAELDLRSSVMRGPCQLVSGGSVNSLGGNVEQGTDTCELDQASDQPGVTVLQLRLGFLGDFGGPTPTYLPNDISVAINAAISDCVVVDQRGAIRGTPPCDSGAVERGNGSLPPTPIFHDGFEQGSAGAWSSLVL